MKAFLYGWAVVAIAIIAGLITGDKGLFRLICEWVFYIAMIVSALLLISPGVKQKNKRKQAVDDAMDLFTARQTGDTSRDENNEDEPPEKPDARTIRKQNTKLAYTVLQAGLPSLIAVLAEYWLSII